MGFTLCTMACHPLGEYQLGPATKYQLKCELKRELRVATSLFTPRSESANQSQPSSVGSSVSYKSGYISGWHNGLHLAQWRAARWESANSGQPPSVSSSVSKERLHGHHSSVTLLGRPCRIAQLSYYKLTGCATASRWARG